jgi:hypothetical protein
VQESSQNCNFIFKKPQINISYVDNRKKCCYCNARYAEYEVDQYAASTEAIEYIGEELYLHFKKNNFDETHQAADMTRFVEFVASYYNVASSFGVGFAISSAKLRDAFGETLCTKNRQVDKYRVNSKFCSTKCQDNCSWSDNCRCH